MGIPMVGENPRDPFSFIISRTVVRYFTMEIALALGGGGIRGLAHIGVIRFLQQEGFVIRAIAGTSAGALVGALISAGYGPNDIKQIFERAVQQPDLFHRCPDEEPSLLGTQGLTQILTSAMNDLTFDRLKIPFVCTAVDINHGQEIILSKGRVVDSLLATIAIPGIFPPKIIDGSVLVDGGVVDPVPVLSAKYLSPSLPVIAVCLYSKSKTWSNASLLNFLPGGSTIPSFLIDYLSHLSIGQAFRTFVHSFEIAAINIAELRLTLDKPDVVIRPEVSQYGILDKVEPEELIRAGEIAAAKSLSELRSAVSFGKKASRSLERFFSPDPDYPINS